MKKENTLPTLIASIILAATWVGAFLLLFSPLRLGKIFAWIFLGGKGLTILMTLVSLATHPSTGWRLFVGRYLFDQQHLTHGIEQALLRFVWELPQLLLGYCYAQLRNITGHIKRVEYLGGATYAIDDGRGDWCYKGISLSCFINIWLTNTVNTDFEYAVRHSFGQILMHEYGHTKDSLRLGWLYLFIVGLPSLISAYLQGIRGHRHKDLYAEKWANRHAQRYFGEKIHDLEA